jgi:DNA-binding CsgD family transcriptional regulator
MKQARNALDAFGQATLSVRPASGRITWQTPLARKLLGDYFGPADEATPAAIVEWIAATSARLKTDPMHAPSPLIITQAARRLIFSLHNKSADEEWLLVLREESDTAVIESMIAAFRLTQKEAEVLYWVIKGKTNKDIGDILGSSPRTVHKHLEHVFEKLGVETRTAAANLALAKAGRGG